MHHYLDKNWDNYFVKLSCNRTILFKYYKLAAEYFMKIFFKFNFKKDKLSHGSIMNKSL